MTKTMKKKLILSWTESSSKENSNGKFLDFIVSGQKLSDYLGIKNSKSVTPFGFFDNKKEQQRTLKEFRFQQATRLPGGRVELYICECCGDIGCGAITAKILDRGDKIIWTDFANQTSEDEIGERINIEQLEFERIDYFKAFATLG